MQRSVRGEDQLHLRRARHAPRAVAEMVIEKAKRLVEHKRDVVILLDPSPAWRAPTTIVPPSGQGTLGGVDSNALQRPSVSSGRRATSRKAVAEHCGDGPDRHRQPHGRRDFRGVQRHRQHGNPPRTQAGGQARLPAIDINKSGTRKEELLLPRTSSTACGFCARC